MHPFSSSSSTIPHLLPLLPLPISPPSNSSFLSLAPAPTSWTYHSDYLFESSLWRAIPGLPARYLSLVSYYGDHLLFLWRATPAPQPRRRPPVHGMSTATVEEQATRSRSRFFYWMLPLTDQPSAPAITHYHRCVTSGGRCAPSITFFGAPVTAFFLLVYTWFFLLGGRGGGVFWPVLPNSISSRMRKKALIDRYISHASNL
jgi:hypothetical protein